MEFKENKPIFIQIADDMCERLLRGEIQPEERIPSVRETAADFQVNPNTVVRSYSYLQDSGIIRNQRGIGYFMTENAREKILQSMQQDFLEKELPQLFRNMELLQISSQTLIEYYENYRSKNSEDSNKNQ